MNGSSVHSGHCAAEAIITGKCNVALITLAGLPRAEGMATGTAPRSYGPAAPDVAFEHLPVTIASAAWATWIT